MKLSPSLLETLAWMSENGACGSTSVGLTVVHLIDHPGCMIGRSAIRAPLRKLESLGLARRTGRKFCRANVWELTTKGRLLCLAAAKAARKAA